MKTVIIIPARLESTRLPGKLLLNQTGRCLIEHTYRSASGSRLADQVIVATDSEQIAAEVVRFGGTTIMTRADHVCGSDRVAEAAERLDADLIVNVQGDEPEIEAAAIDLAIGLLQQHDDVPMATLATPIRQQAQLDDPACVKVVIDSKQQAMYFSRSPIPFARQWDDGLLDGSSDCLPDSEGVFLQHIGLYAYRREFLAKITSLPPSTYEKIESLEQLRVLQAGHRILVGTVDRAAPGIDTPTDYAAFVSRCQN